MPRKRTEPSVSTTAALPDRDTQTIPFLFGISGYSPQRERSVFMADSGCFHGSEQGGEIVTFLPAFFA
jgi:hypothetical protein